MDIIKCLAPMGGSDEDGRSAPVAALALLSVVDHALSQLRASLSATEAAAVAAELAQMMLCSRRLGGLLASGAGSQPQPPQDMSLRSEIVWVHGDPAAAAEGAADSAEAAWTPPSATSAANPAPPRRESLPGESPRVLDSDETALTVLFQARTRSSSDRHAFSLLLLHRRRSLRPDDDAATRRRH